MKTIKNLFILILAVILTSCDKEITLKLPASPNLLVVEAQLELVKGKVNQKQSVKLSTLGNYFDNVQTPRVNNAIVTISDSKGNTYELLKEEGTQGIYSTVNLIPEKDVEYTLNITWNGQEYTAKEKLVSVPEIENIYQIFEEENQFEDEGIKVSIDFTDPANETNYYFWELLQNGKNSIIPDPGNSQNLIASDKLFNGKSIVGYLPSEEKVFNPGDLALVRQIGISKAYYDYLFLLFEKNGQTGQLFDIPPSGIKGNIINKVNPDIEALGYFSVVEIDEKTLTIKPN
ncbi:MAG: DUF4249 domain-containing protein [Chryseotalea sp.]